MSAIAIPNRRDRAAPAAADPTLTHVLLRAARVCAACVCALAVLVLLGWQLNVDALKSALWGGEAMKANTAIGLIAAAACMLALTYTGPRAHRLAGVAGVVVLLDGAAHLSEHVFGVNLGIDQAVFRDMTPHLAAPGRMAPNTAVVFVLLGCALLLAGSTIAGVAPTSTLASAVITVGLIARVGKLSGTRALSSLGGATTMPVPAALSFELLGAALLLVSPMRGSMRLLAARGPGGALARRLLPMVTLLPPALVLLGGIGQRLGLYGWQVGYLVMILLLIAAAALLVWTLALDLDRKARAREGTIADLRKSEGRFRDTLENATVGMALEDTDGRVVQANRALCEMLGYSEEDLVGKTFIEFTHAEDTERNLEQMRLMLAGDLRSYRTEKRYLHADGHVVWAILSVSLARDAGGLPSHFIAQMQDISARKRSEERFAYLAYHDELTDLPNRAMFQDHLGVAVNRAQRQDLGLAVLYIDVNQFKVVNDSLGHAAGDQVLCEVAARLRRAVRAEDLVARHSGDQFLVLLADLHRQDERLQEESGLSGLPSSVAATVRRAHQALAEPFVAGEQHFTLEASIGVSVFPDDAECAEELIHHAGVAMNDGKVTAPGLSRRYSRDAREEGGELALRSRLRSAVERREFVLHYQPILELAPALAARDDGRQFLAEHTVMVEALVRWQDPVRGLIPPDEFIPMAEQSGLIEPIGEWVIAEVIRQARRWKQQGVDVSIAFNLSPRQMRQPTVIRRLLETMTANGGDPERFVVELTESVAVESPAHTQLQFREARASGLRSAVDDFGAGYSSLRRLLEIHPDFIKIDRSLTEGIPTNAGAMAIVEGAVRVSRGLGATPILEGIETEEQWRFAVEQGCTLGQGFFFGRPQPAADLTPLLIVKSPTPA
jgi:diguanylate cyclase (GGDEF)-like protein/PAS domain S-box-containing protein